MNLSVILCTHNPRAAYLERALASLRAQTLPAPQWELILVDNDSTPAIDLQAVAPAAPANFVLVREPARGLTPARLRGIAEARGNVLVFVDDDNVLDPHYLEHALGLFTRSPRLGAAGGAVVPEWETPPPAWMQPFQGLLALHEHGAEPRTAAGSPSAPWPDFAPVGAGLIVRRRDAERYAQELADAPARRILDRQGGALSSGGDCDLVFTILHHGSNVAYEPALRVTHLIPASRLQPDYLARLNRGIMRSWVSVLALHGQCPWPPIPRWTVALRAARAWVRRRSWQSPANRVRWAGDLGQFEGQADLPRTSTASMRHS